MLVVSINLHAVDFFLQDTGLEYDRYLKEIVSVLEDDVEFRKKMESADPEHFKVVRYIFSDGVS